MMYYGQSSLLLILLIVLLFHVCALFLSLPCCCDAFILPPNHHQPLKQQKLIFTPQHYPYTSIMQQRQQQRKKRQQQQQQQQQQQIDNIPTTPVSRKTNSTQTKATTKSATATIKSISDKSITTRATTINGSSSSSRGGSINGCCGNDSDSNDTTTTSTTSSSYLTTPDNKLDWKKILLKNPLVFLELDHMRYRLLNSRSYAPQKSQFLYENRNEPPALDDMIPAPSKSQDSFYISVPFFMFVFTSASLLFPIVAMFFDTFVDMAPDKLDEITNKFVPGIAILYGTFSSLTLSILYNRQRQIQDSVSKETSLLAFLLQNLILAFRNDQEKMVQAGKFIASQTRTLINETRGVEFMTVVYRDPYAKVLELITKHEQEPGYEHISQGPTLGTCRDVIKELRMVRASRLSDESLALAPTHFIILQVLTVLILMGFIISVLPTVDDLGYAPFESSILFGLLSSVYVLFYSVSNDLNDPYNGVFQLRRASAFVYLLEIKHLVTNEPWLVDSISFEQVDSEICKCETRYPGLEEVWFKNEQNFCN